MMNSDSDVVSGSCRKKLFRMVIPSFSRFNIYSSVAKYTTALGPVLIATMVSKLHGWDAEVIDENNFHRNGLCTRERYPDHELLQQLRPADAVGFYGGLSSTVGRIYKLSEFYKNCGCLTIAGGQHFVDDNIEDGLNHNIDYLILGEGEIAVQELFNAVYNDLPVDDIAGLAWKKDGKLIIRRLRQENNDLDSLPLPDFSLLRCSKLSLYPVSWVRGCGMNCEFCTVKGKVRCPSVRYILNQMTSLYEGRGATYFFIVDDLFGQNREKTLCFCSELREYQLLLRVKFFITVQIRLDRADDEELLRAMRLANIRVVAIGYESPLEDDLSAMNKKLKAQEMIRLTAKFHHAGFMVHGMFIFGYPLKNPEAHSQISLKQRIDSYWRFIRKARIDTIQILLPVPLPGTELTKRLKDSGRIFPLDKIGWEFYDGNFPLFIPDPPLRPEDMFVASGKLMKRFYRFRNMFYAGFNIIFFPMIIFPSFNLKSGWKRWYKSWRNNLWKFIGWNILRKWTIKFDKEEFLERVDKIISSHHK
ncbi:MAG: radical SAM protein [Victivallales bacterium]|nr:radical SAM protein [Victivallales bacterium]